MYYKSVNRGVTLTVPGSYTLLLLVTLGFIAIASGYNGVYLALSMGFAILIISGLLSEKAMKHYELEGLAETFAEPETPFSLRFQVTNKHPALFLYGIENLLFAEAPKLGWLSRVPQALMSATVPTLPPKSTREWSGTCRGLPRGLYREFVMVPRTIYPFGLLVKFKVTRLKARIVVPPRYLAALAATLRQELRGRQKGAEDTSLFHSHRPYTPRDPLKRVDWKKSAGRDVREWVIKRYESTGKDIGLLIVIDCNASASEAEYESILAAARTACDVAREAGLPVALGCDQQKPVFGREGCLDLLINFPRFHNFKDRSGGLPKPPEGECQRIAYLRLTLTAHAHHWGGILESPLGAPA